MKHVIQTLVLFLIVLALSSCTSLPGEVTRGTVIYIDVEGGFYGIMTEEGERLLPLNLNEELQIHGMLIRFRYTEELDVVTIQQWGKPVSIHSILFSSEPE